MVKPTKVRSEAARLAGLAKRVSYPVGRMDIEYCLLDGEGQAMAGTHTIKLIVTDDEARQIGDQFYLLAAEIRTAGGTKQ